MAASFQLNWHNDAIVDPGETNAQTQSALYRSRQSLGSFLSDGFNPANPLALNVISAQSKPLTDNMVWQFKIQTNCDVGGPSDNSNGILEAVNFVCIAPIVTFTYEASSITINTGTTDIAKAKILLFKIAVPPASDVQIGATVFPDKVGSSITHNVSGLLASTAYEWRFALGTTVGGTLIYSDIGSQLNAYCKYPFNTAAPPTCDPVTGLTVSSLG